VPNYSPQTKPTNLVVCPQVDCYHTTASYYCAYYYY